MINSWTNEDIEAIMVQLNNQNLPFKGCELSSLGKGMVLLGAGAFANVYEAVSKRKKTNQFAVKVIGFGSKHVDSDIFRSVVEAQRNLGHSVDYIVKIYDSVELRVWIKGEHEVEKVEEINPFEKTKPEGDFLHLQFVLMEKISPVLKSRRRSHFLTPTKLQEYDQKEIMKLAYEVGTAIEKAHHNNLIHRDIKLENIFYDAKRHQYKLGDFGIAKTVDDGMASTVVFTKGYGAPEVVGTLEDKYDYTADIYSFGMLLYVLLNEMKFPESNDYRPTVYQYIQGYIPPEPLNGTDEFVNIVLRMLSFNPDDRYQSMEEVLNEFEKLRFGKGIKYQKEHKSSALVFGTVFALIGSAFWKMSFMPDLTVMFNVWEYIFCTLCVGRAMLHIGKRKTWMMGAAIFCLGLFLLFASGFTWYKLIFLLILAVCHYLPGVIAGSALVVNATCWMMNKNGYSVIEFSNYRWMAVLLISLSVLLLFLYFLLEERSEMLTKMYFGRQMFWIVATLCYTILVIFANQVRSIDVYDMIFGENTLQWILSWNPNLVGICGVGFCVGWVARERFLMFIESKLEQKAQEERYYR